VFAGDKLERPPSRFYECSRSEPQIIRPQTGYTLHFLPEIIIMLMGLK
jgi:hypothetical protein